MPVLTTGADNIFGKKLKKKNEKLILFKKNYILLFILKTHAYWAKESIFERFEGGEI